MNVVVENGACHSIAGQPSSCQVPARSEAGEGESPDSTLRPTSLHMPLCGSTV
jgi:hypothetical protein